MLGRVNKNRCSTGPVKCHDIRVPWRGRSVCGLAAGYTDRCGLRGVPAGDIDESPDSWPARVICQEFHYRATSNLWRGVFIVVAQITGSRRWSTDTLGPAFDIMSWVVGLFILSAVGPICRLIFNGWLFYLSRALISEPQNAKFLLWKLSVATVFRFQNTCLLVCEQQILSCFRH